MAPKVTSKANKVTPAGRSRRNDASSTAASSTAASSAAVVVPSTGVVIAYDDGHGGIQFAPRWSAATWEGIYMSKMHKTPANILMKADGEWYIDKYLMTNGTWNRCLTWSGEPDDEATTATTYPVYTFDVRVPLNEAAEDDMGLEGLGGVIDRVIGLSRWATKEEVRGILRSISDDSDMDDV